MNLRLMQLKQNNIHHVKVTIKNYKERFDYNARKYNLNDIENTRRIHERRIARSITVPVGELNSPPPRHSSALIEAEYRRLIESMERRQVNRSNVASRIIRDTTLDTPISETNRTAPLIAPSAITDAEARTRYNNNFDISFTQMYPHIITPFER